MSTNNHESMRHNCSILRNILSFRIFGETKKRLWVAGIFVSAICAVNSTAKIAPLPLSIFCCCHDRPVNTGTQLLLRRPRTFSQDNSLTVIYRLFGIVPTLTSGSDWDNLRLIFFFYCVRRCFRHWLIWISHVRSYF